MMSGGASGLERSLGLPTRVVLRPGALADLGLEAWRLGAGRALLVTDPGLTRAGYPERARAILAAAGLAVAVHDEVREDPTTLDAERCAAAARAFSPDLFVALGGGSSIDTAKAADLLLTNGGKMESYRGRHQATDPLLPLIAIPTTAGTGSEVQSFALIAEERSHQKMACGDPGLAPRVALLDPELGVTQPERVTACTGIDAIGHAVETAVTSARNERSAPLSRAAFALAFVHLPRALARPADVDERAELLRAACLAGAAIEHSMLGAAHALANPLSARYGLPHGHAVGLLLPHVVRFNAEDPEAAGIYAELAAAAGIAPAGGGPRLAALELAARLEELLGRVGLGARLGPLGVSRAALPALAAEAAQQWTAKFNPREVDALDLQALYAAAS
jgi:alcohol dehydrogenase